VKWIEDFREASHDIEPFPATMTATRDRLPAGWHGAGTAGQIYADAGAYVRSTAHVGPRNIAQFMSGRTASEHRHRSVPDGHQQDADRTYEVRAVRGRLFRDGCSILPAPKDLGIDRVDFRRRNLVLRHEMP